MKKKLESLGKLKEFLPHGVLLKIAEELGYTRQYVGYVLRGKYYNTAIIERATEIAMQEKHKKEALNQKIEEITK